MGLLDETVSVPRRTMTLFFLIDTSGSMEGTFQSPGSIPHRTGS